MPPVPVIVTVNCCGLLLLLLLLLPPPPQEAMKPSRTTINIVSITIFARRRRSNGSAPSSKPKAMGSPIQGSRGEWFRAELDAETVRFSVCVPPPLRAVVPLDGETVIAVLLVVAVQLTLSAKVVEVSVTVAGVELP